MSLHSNNVCESDEQNVPFVCSFKFILTRNKFTLFYLIMC